MAELRWSELLQQETRALLYEIEGCIAVTIGSRGIRSFAVADGKVIDVEQVMPVIQSLSFSAAELASSLSLRAPSCTIVETARERLLIVPMLLQQRRLSACIVLGPQALVRVATRAVAMAQQRMSDRLAEDLLLAMPSDSGS